MKFIIYGSGCSKCQQLTTNVEEAAKALGVNYEIQKITDTNSIIDVGVMRTPALAINDNIIIEGKVPSIDDIKKLLT